MACYSGEYVVRAAAHSGSLWAGACAGSRAGGRASGHVGNVFGDNCGVHRWLRLPSLLLLLGGKGASPAQVGVLPLPSAPAEFQEGILLSTRNVWRSAVSASRSPALFGWIRRFLGQQVLRFSLQREKGLPAAPTLFRLTFSAVSQLPAIRDGDGRQDSGLGKETAASECTRNLWWKLPL